MRQGEVGDTSRERLWGDAEAIHPTLDEQFKSAGARQKIPVIVSMYDTEHWGDHIQLLALEGLEVTGEEPVIAVVYGSMDRDHVAVIAGLPFVQLIEPDVEGRALV